MDVTRGAGALLGGWVEFRRANGPTTSSPPREGGRKEREERREQGAQDERGDERCNWMVMDTDHTHTHTLKIDSELIQDLILWIKFSVYICGELRSAGLSFKDQLMIHNVRN